MSFSFVDNEKSIQAFWKEHDVFQKTLDWSKDFPKYVAYDGPPFATGLPHHGHLLASTLKDVIPRYFTQNGYYVERRFGWDCHGLPIEHEINKSMGLQAHEAVEKLGIAGYNQACRDIVLRYRKEWRTTIERLGRWVEFDRDYKTMDANFMESVWWVFHELWQKDMIYQGVKVVPFSTSLETALSNFEAGSNYQSVQDPAITVLLTLNDREALAIWTTTPWTLPANLAVGVHPTLKYCLVKIDDVEPLVWIAEARLADILKKRSYTIEKTVLGEALIGRHYQPLFTHLKEQTNDQCYQVLSADFVDVETGSGLVHIAPAFGEDDYNLCRQNNIDVLLCPITDQGKFDESFPPLTGQYIKDADKWIMKSLKEANQLLDQSVIVHNYPFCPRSDTPLIYKAIPSWFVAVSSIKDKLQQSNEQIYWVPDHLKKGRFGKWLANARDWAISRNRVWGTPIPLWQNDVTGKFICIDSIETLKRYSGKSLTDLHREHVDPIVFSIEGEEGTYHRVEEVLDCWFESGSMPYAQCHYPFENKESFEKNFPAQFIAEGLDQTRGWFYTLTILSTILFNRPAFENVIVSGIVVAEDGKKMSKRLKNYTAPDILMDTYGADALRLYLISSNLVKAEEQRFSDLGVKEVIRQTLLPWYNAFKFFNTYAEIDQWQASEDPQAYTDLDRWIRSRLQSLIIQVKDNMAAHKLYLVIPPLLTFIDELTNTYIRMNRNRFWGEDTNPDKLAAYQTLFEVLMTLSKLMAPFAPHLSESTYQALKKFDKEDILSVHLCPYPKADTASQDLALETGVALLQEVINMARQQRTNANIKTKTPLSSITIIHKDNAILNTLKPLSDRLCIELNVKNVVFKQDEENYIRLFAKPNLPVLGKRHGKDLPRIKAYIDQLTTDQLKNIENDEPLVLDGFTFSKETLLIYREALPNTHALSNRYITIVLDTRLNDSLISEGTAREMVSQIQKTRKQLDLKIDQRIKLVLCGDQDTLAVFKTHQAYILGEVLATAYTTSDTPQTHAFHNIPGSFEIIT